VTFSVSPQGSDDGDGTDVHPFRTLERAQMAARAARQSATSDVTIELRGGVHTRSATLALDARDSGPAGHRMIYRSRPGERAVVSGGAPLSGWTVDTPALWHADLRGPSPARFRQLYVAGQWAQRARGAAPASISPFGSHATMVDEGGFDADAPAPARWGNPTGVELGFLGSWTHRICGVARIDALATGGSRFVVAQPCWHLANNWEGDRLGPLAYIENAKELIDQPGEWYFDPTQRRIWYSPRAGETPEATVATVPVLEALVDAQGTLDSPLHDVVFEGITFADTGWTRPSELLGHPDIQTNVVPNPDPAKTFTRNGRLTNIHNESTQVPATVTLAAAYAVRFERCTFTRMGATGLWFGLGAHDNAVIGSHFHELAGTAVQVGGIQRADHHPDDPRLVVRANVVANNYIHDIGLEYQGSVAVFVGYTDGTVIAHNEIARIPYSAVSVGWGWGQEDAGGAEGMQPFLFDTPTTARNNVVEANHIHDHMRLRADGGGVYTLSNQPGTVIRGNLIHDAARNPGGVYLDEGSGFMEVTGNVVFGVPVPIFLHNGAQARDKTCNIHDNAAGVVPADPAYPKAVADASGLEPAFRDLLVSP
jgi:hypothetical protein